MAVREREERQRKKSRRMAKFLVFSVLGTQEKKQMWVQERPGC